MGMLYRVSKYSIFHNTLLNIVYLNLGSISTRIPETVLIEKHTEVPVVVISEDDDVDIIGPPDPVSNLRPVIRKHLINETVLQQRLRAMQDATQQWNQNFWEKHNTKFTKERQEYINLHIMKSTEKQQPTADEMSEFYKKFLDENWETHIKYNFEWYKRNFRLMILALRVSIEKVLHKF